MAKGIRITVTAFKDVRAPQRNDVKIKMWTGTKWVYLCWLPYPPKMAEMYGSTPHPYDIEIEFLPAGVVPHDRLVYLREVLPLFRKSGLIHQKGYL